jgi:XTP/dITP diphosphohydrolase
MRDLCFATNNKHKLEEVRLAIGSQFNLISLEDLNCKEELPETRDTLEGNSLQKAEYVFQHYHTACFADDTGLEVEALQGAPGVYSARYAGLQKNSQDNIQLLLKNLSGQINRKARFRTIITLIGLESQPVFFEGIINGTIIENERGQQGFGYDPVFIPEGFTRTFAEMTLAEKNQLSHRGIAIKKLSSYLKNYKP